MSTKNMFSYIVSCVLLLLSFSLLSSCQLLQNESTSDAKCDQSTTRANTLSDDADDLHKQLESEARDRMKLGHPKTIWVFHLPRNSDDVDSRTKRDNSEEETENRREKKLFHTRHYTTDEPNFSTDLTFQPSTVDIENLLATNYYKDGKSKAAKHKEHNLDTTFSYTTKTSRLYEFEKPMKKLKNTKCNMHSNNTDASDNAVAKNVALKDNKQQDKHHNFLPIEDAESLNKLVEKAKNISSSMPLSEGYNADILDSPSPVKKKKKGKKVKVDKKPEKKKSKKQPPWSYRDQANWSLSYPNCAGMRQSPISIPVQMLIKAKGARDLCFDNFDVLPTSLSLCASECRLTMTGVWEPRHWPTVYGGAAHARRYKFHSLSVMWPSEHKIEGMLYPMETQFLFVDVEYATMEDALDAVMRDPQSVLIIATLYKFGKTIHSGAAELLKSAMSCRRYKCMSQDLKPLAYFCPPFKKYACYYGSLTTPPCTESVLWLIRARALNVTWDQYQDLLKVSAKGAFYTRESQMLNDRKLFFFE